MTSPPPLSQVTWGHPFSALRNELLQTQHLKRLLSPSSAVPDPAGCDGLSAQVSGGNPGAGGAGCHLETLGKREFQVWAHVV